MKKILAIILPILIIGGAVVGLAFMGVLKIPGLTPKKLMNAKGKGKGTVVTNAPVTPPPSGDKGSSDAPKKKPADAPTPKVASAPIKLDPDQGAEQLAIIWNQLDPSKFKDLLKDWKDPEVARVFLKMKPDIVAGILAVMDMKRASNISKLMEKQSSVVIEDQTS
ncbi:MAG TPA: hypothetical protein VGL56_09495 [Fimbriimonadaceae bacterium]|jgi:hypothetical protein